MQCSVADCQGNDVIEEYVFNNFPKDSINAIINKNIQSFKEIEKRAIKPNDIVLYLPLTNSDLRLTEIHSDREVEYINEQLSRGEILIIEKSYDDCWYLFCYFIQYSDETPFQKSMKDSFVWPQLFENSNEHVLESFWINDDAKGKMGNSQPTCSSIVFDGERIVPTRELKDGIPYTIFKIVID